MFVWRILLLYVCIKHVLQVAQFLETSLGATVRTVTIEKFRYAVDMWGAKMTTGGGRSFCEYMGGEGGPVRPGWEFARWLVGRSPHTLPAIGLGLVEHLDHLLEASNARSLAGFAHLEKEVAAMLDERAVLLYPTHPRPAPYHNQPLLYPFNWAYTGIFNALGLPVTQVPLGLGRAGVPLGLQVVAGMNQDRLTLAVAQKLASSGVAHWVNPGT